MTGVVVAGGSEGRKPIARPSSFPACNGRFQEVVGVVQDGCQLPKIPAPATPGNTLNTQAVTPRLSLRFIGSTMIGNMGATGNASHLFLVLLSLLIGLPVVAAMDTGDALALLLVMFLSCIGLCACLGLYARKRNGEL
ncbi:small integral membrane protein 30 isoform X1 [Podarcis raffonei]|uniref:small integral membrane protein 30 isoform X1 n=2 Tax=Podarcis raffonei TaxID=65483 RepID=UPI00232981E4|nr:small integral membrane protein 30 isoform X1 [Podarcis raffonei]